MPKGLGHRKVLMGVRLPLALSVDNKMAGDQNRKLRGWREAIKSIKPEMTLSWALLLEEMVGGVRSPEVTSPWNTI